MPLNKKSNCESFSVDGGFPHGGKHHRKKNDMKQKNSSFKKIKVKFASSANQFSTPLLALVSLGASAQIASGTPPESGRLSRVTNQDSQRYEINQTFDGSAYFKDNHIWVYDKGFADLFGMPAKYIEPIEGITAAAFRIETAPYQQCGFGGRDEACTHVEQCYLDLYFNESLTPLPWATESTYMWLPRYGSLRWLRAIDRTEKPAGMSAPNAQTNIIRNEALAPAALMPFADPATKREAIFTSNIGSSKGGPEEVSGGTFAVLGYSRAFYKMLSIVTLQFRCSSFERKTLNFRLDAKTAVYDPPIARFNRIFLPEGFVQRMKDATAGHNKRSTEFFRKLLSPSLGASSATPTAPSIPR